jgi:hypothetical protein
MKRFRVLGFDFDVRVHSLTQEIQDHWEDRVKESHRLSREHVERGLIAEFGEIAAQQKKHNFIEIGPKPLSVLAFHNRFLEHIRTAFVMSAYYPSLTAACALGERILNHLVLTLRDDFKSTREYKRVYKKHSFDDWGLAIDTLEAWKVLLPEVVTEYRELRDRRNDAIHFRPEVDQHDRPLALSAIKSLNVIVAHQFGAFGQQPWFITGVPGETYIQKEWEVNAFVRKVYLPNCAELGPRHKVQSVMPWVIKDAAIYENREVTDEEFCMLRRAAQAR